jgi:hypothetical protein
MFVTPCHRRLRPPTRRHIGQTRTDQPRLQKAGNPWSQRGEIRSPQYYVGKGSGRLPPAAMRAAVLALEAATPTGLAHSGPWRPGYLRLPAPPMPPRSSWPPRPRHHATTAIPQTGSTAEHATTPEHPCPGVVARTGPQAVNPSPVSGESMASGGYACGRASPPPTSPGNAADAAGVTARGGHRPAMAGHCGKRPRGAFFPGAAPEPGWRWRHQPGPWGRWPTRRCAAERHLTTDLPENASGAAGVTAAGEVPRHEQPQGPPSRGRSSSTY